MYMDYHCKLGGRILDTVIPMRRALKVDDLLDEDRRQLIRFCTMLARTTFGVAALQALVVLDNHSPISAVMLLALLSISLASTLGRIFVIDGHPRRTIGVVSTTMFVCSIVCSLLDPKIAPVSLLASLLSVGLAMPFLNSRELKIVCLACAVSICIIGIEFVFVTVFTHAHTLASDISMLVAMCAAGWVCLNWLLGYHTRLFTLVSELRAYHSDLEGQVRARTKQLEEELARARELERQIRRAKEQIILAREEERRRLKRELHDEFGPNISGCILTLDDLADYVVERPQHAPDVLTRVCSNLRTIVGDMRQLAYALLLPAELDLGLRPAISQLVERLKRQAQNETDNDDCPEVVLDLPSKMPELPAAVEVAALRIVQEGLTNVHRHATATHCTVRARILEELCTSALEAGPGIGQSIGQSTGPPDARYNADHVQAGGRDKDVTLEISIIDDGVGMASNQLPGVGISTMRERASELGGQLTIVSMRQSGTTITARMPATLSSVASPDKRHDP